MDWFWTKYGLKKLLNIKKYLIFYEGIYVNLLIIKNINKTFNWNKSWI